MCQKSGYVHHVPDLQFAMDHSQELYNKACPLKPYYKLSNDRANNGHRLWPIASGLAGSEIVATNCHGCLETAGRGTILDLRRVVLMEL